MADATAVTVADARKGLSEILNRVAYGKEQVVVTRHGRRVAAIVPIGDLDFLSRMRAFVARDDVDRALRELDAGRAKPWSQLRRELGL